MNKKAIIILAAIFLLIVGTLGFLIYSRNSSTGGETPPTADNTGTAPDTGAPGGDNAGTGDNTPQPTSTPEKFVMLTQGSEQVISPALFYNGNGVTYLTGQGQLMKADFETSAEGKLSLTRARSLDIVQKNNIARILWPKNGDDFIAELRDSSGNNSYSYFNFSTGAYIGLPQEVRALEWMPAGDKIIYVWVSEDAEQGEKATLNIAKPDTTAYAEIAA